MSYSAVKHIIWDWNGTILDDAELCWELLNEQLEKCGVSSLSVDEFRERTCHPVRDMYAKLGVDLERHDYPAIAHEFHQRYEERRHECDLRHGIREFLEESIGRGIEHSILSAHPQQMLEDIVGHHDLRKYFRNVSGLGNSLAGGKIENASKLFELIALAQEEVLMIGDTDHDAEVAAHLGIRCVFVHGGHQSSSRLAVHGGVIVQSGHELSALLQRAI